MSSASVTCAISKTSAVLRARAGGLAFVLMSAGLMAGCSADISRFGGGSSGLLDSTPAASSSRRNGSGVVTNNGGGESGQGQGGAYYPPSSGNGNIQVSALDQAPAAQPRVGQSVPFDRPRKAPAAAAAAQPAKPIPQGSTIDVAPGDTVYGLARKHGVAVNELMTVNALTSPNLKPGQKLILPANRSLARAVPTRQPAVAAAATAPAAPAAAPRSVKAAAPAPAAPVAAAAAVGAAAAAAPAMKPTIINKQVAAVQPAGTTTDTPAAAAETPAAEPAPKGTQVASAGGAAAPGAKFRWPVKGKVIASFGARTDGTHNDGVNVAVPAGTDVLAAEQGTVAYAGSELKGYGNLVLLRHDNGWVTAYAHNEEIMVKRGDKIKRGQAIAKAGKSGTVDQPQVHFELRQGQKPVDPMPYMEKM
jgi:murein DD-endopeptidase MepM/ murein hydrolase activator NlpD